MSRLAALAGLLLLSACGVRGDLTPAPPLWGADRPAPEAPADQNTAPTTDSGADVPDRLPAPSEADPEAP